MSLLKNITQFVSKLTKQKPNLKDIKIVDKVTTPATTMNPTSTKLAKQAYVPMIKFIGTKHPIIKHPDKIIAHPCSMNKILPGSSECISVEQYLKNTIPFKVVPFKSIVNQNAVGLGKYTYVERPLQENELASVLDLPLRFRPKPIDDLELDSINSGGAF